MKVHFHFSQFIIIQNHITNIHPILATFSFNFDLILNDYELKMKHERSGRFDLDILLRTISSSKKNRQKLDFVVEAWRKVNLLLFPQPLLRKK